MLQLVEVHIPSQKTVPAILHALTPEEKYLVLKLGCDCVDESKKTLSKMSQQELGAKIHEETQKVVLKLEADLFMEREIMKRCEEKWMAKHEKEKEEVRERFREKDAECRKLELELNVQRETMKLKEVAKLNIYDMKISMLTSQREEQEKNLDDIVQNRLKRESETQSFLLDEKTKQLEQSKQVFEATLLNNAKETDQLNRKIAMLMEQLKINQEDNGWAVTEKLSQEREKCHAQLEKEKDRCKHLLEEKDRQVDKIREVHERILINQTKSTSHKGADGEKLFCDYAETFMDFKGFENIDKHTQGGEGDFHLHFEEFDVLVDAKNYKKKVPHDQREKIKKDLLKNEHIHFAWLVSLNTSIEKFDKAPLMFEWINTNQCILYINNLSSSEDPKKFLRVVWNVCKELMKLTGNVNFDETELITLRENTFKVMDRMKGMRKTIREINTSLNTTRNLIQVMDDELKGILEMETNSVIASDISLFDDWWEQHIELSHSDDLLSSTEMWVKFKQDNKLALLTSGASQISTEKFKQYIKSIVPMHSILLRNKNATSAFDVKGIKFKELKIVTHPL